MNVRAVLMIGVVEHNFVQASPIKYFPALRALRKMLFFFKRTFLVLVEGHFLAFVFVRPCTYIRRVAQAKKL